MIVTDTKGVILSANRAFVSLTGYTMEELVGTNGAFVPGASS